MDKEDFLPKGYSFDIFNNTSILKSFLEFGENNIEKELEILQVAYKQNCELTYKLLTENPEIYNEIFERNMDEHHNDWHLLAIEIGSRLRQSVLLQLYSFMESYLYKQCNTHKWKNNKEYSVKELKGNTDLDRVATYYKNSVNINIKEAYQWQFIDTFRRLRNIIVHSEGRITNKEEYNHMKLISEGNFQLKKLIDEYEYQIILSDRKFVDKCISTVEDFLSQLVII